MKRWIPAAGLFLIMSAVVQTTADAANMHIQGRTLVTSNTLYYQVTGPESWQLGPVESRKATFNGHPYDVTMAAFIGTTDFVMVHAERVLDASGSSNYDSLAVDVLDRQKTHSRILCAEIAADDIAGEHDLHYLDIHGFSPLPAVLLKQHFITSKDHNAEIVISLGQRVASCDKKKLPAEKRMRLIDKLSKQVKFIPVSHLPAAPDANSHGIEHSP